MPRGRPVGWRFQPTRSRRSDLVDLAITVSLSHRSRRPALRAIVIEHVSTLATIATYRRRHDEANPVWLFQPSRPHARRHRSRPAHLDLLGYGRPTISTTRATQPARLNLRDSTRATTSRDLVARRPNPYYELSFQPARPQAAIATRPICRLPLALVDVSTRATPARPQTSITTRRRHRSGAPCGACFNPRDRRHRSRPDPSALGSLRDGLVSTRATADNDRNPIPFAEAIFAIVMFQPARPQITMATAPSVGGGVGSTLFQPARPQISIAT